MSIPTSDETLDILRAYDNWNEGETSSDDFMRGNGKNIKIIIKVFLATRIMQEGDKT